MEATLYQAYLEGVLRLSATGIWYHNDTQFTNKKVRDLFFRSIVWDDSRKEYLIRIGLGEATFNYEDTVYFVHQLLDEQNPWQILLSDGSTEELSPTSLAIGSDNQLYCIVKDSHRARFSKNAYQHVTRYCVSEDEIQIGTQKVKIKQAVDV